MARETKADREARVARLALVHIHARAQEGTEYLTISLRGARRNVERLTRPGSRHEHGEPYTVKSCGWCGNIHTWRAAVERAEVALPHAEKLERAVFEMARLMTQTALWETVKEVYPRMNRDVVRRIWHAAKKEK